MKFNKIDYAAIMGVAAYSEDAVYECVDRMIHANQQCHAMILMSSFLWNQKNKPFYRVWPSIIEALSRMKLEKLFKVIPEFEDYGPIAFEFPAEYKLKIEYTCEECRSSVSDLIEGKPIESGKQVKLDDELPGFLAMIRNGLLIMVPTITDDKGTKSFSSFSLNDTVPSDELLDSQRVIARIALGVMLMSKSDELFQAVVLNKDKERYEQTHNEKYVEKAKRYGINGFDIGKELPTVAEFQERARAMGLAGKKAPHLRLMHPALYWTGKGRTTPIIKLIETTFVNYDDIRKLPQGYYIRKEKEDG